MADLAALVIEVDTSKIEQAQKKMEDFLNSARKVDDQVKQGTGHFHEFGQGASVMGHGLGSGTESLIEFGTEILAVYATFETLKKGFDSLIEKNDEFISSIERQKLMLRSTNNISGQSLPGLNEFAEEQAKKTMFTVNQIRQAQIDLLTQTNVRGDIFEKAILGAENLSAILGGDLLSNTMRLGRALNDPAVAMNTLVRSGIRFTATEKEKIGTLVEENKIYEAQMVILDKLAGMQGAAEAMRNSTVGGLFKGMGDEWEAFITKSEAGKTIYAETYAILSQIFGELKQILITLDEMAPVIRDLIDGINVVPTMIAYLALTVMEFCHDFPIELHAAIVMITEFFVVSVTNIGNLWKALLEDIVKSWNSVHFSFSDLFSLKSPVHLDFFMSSIAQTTMDMKNSLKTLWGGAATEALKQMKDYDDKIEAGKQKLLNGLSPLQSDFAKAKKKLDDEQNAIKEPEIIPDYLRFQSNESPYAVDQAAASKKQKFIESLGLEETAVDKLYAAQKRGNEAYRETKAEMDAIKKLSDAEIKNNDALGGHEYQDLKNRVKALDEYKDKLKDLQEAQKQFNEIGKQAGQDIAQAFKDVIISGKDLQTTLANLIQQLAELAIRMAFVQSMGGKKSEGIGGGILSGMFGFAHGGVVQAFASGGIVDSPTIFPMASGMGLMGEAGPEAVMPLTRMPNGNLGVAGGGGGNFNMNTNVSVTVNGGSSGNQTNDSRLAQETGRQVVGQLRQMVQQEIRNQSRPGNMLNPLNS